MARNFDGLPGRKVTVDFPLETHQLASYPPNFIAGTCLVGDTLGLEFGQQIFKLVNVFLECQAVFRSHRCVPTQENLLRPRKFFQAGRSLVEGEF